MGDHLQPCSEHAQRGGNEKTNLATIVRADEASHKAAHQGKAKFDTVHPGLVSSCHTVVTERRIQVSKVSQEPISALASEIIFLRNIDGRLHCQKSARLSIVNTEGAYSYANNTTGDKKVDIAREEKFSGVLITRPSFHIKGRDSGDGDDIDDDGDGDDDDNTGILAWDGAVRGIQTRTGRMRKHDYP